MVSNKFIKKLNAFRGMMIGIIVDLVDFVRRKKYKNKSEVTVYQN
jgi:hypothetical protein